MNANKIKAAILALVYIALIPARVLGSGVELWLTKLMFPNDPDAQTNITVYGWLVFALNEIVGNLNDVWLILKRDDAAIAAELAASHAPDGGNPPEAR